METGAGFRLDEAGLNVVLLFSGCRLVIDLHGVLAPCYHGVQGLDAVRKSGLPAGALLRLLGDYSCAFASLFISLTALMPGLSAGHYFLNYDSALAYPEVILLLLDSLLSRTASLRRKEPLPFIISHLHFLSLGRNYSI